MMAVTEFWPQDTTIQFPLYPYRLRRREFQPGSSGDCVYEWYFASAAKWTNWKDGHDGSRQIILNIGDDPLRLWKTVTLLEADLLLVRGSSFRATTANSFSVMWWHYGPADPTKMGLLMLRLIVFFSQTGYLGVSDISVPIRWDIDETLHLVQWFFDVSHNSCIKGRWFSS